MNVLTVTCEELITEYFVPSSDGLRPETEHNHCEQASETWSDVKCFIIQSPMQLIPQNGIHLGLNIPTKADRYKLNAQMAGSSFILMIGSNKTIVSFSSSLIHVPFNQFSNVQLKMTRIRSVHNPPDYMCGEDTDYIQADCLSKCQAGSGGAFFAKITHILLKKFWIPYQYLFKRCNSIKKEIWAIFRKIPLRYWKYGPKQVSTFRVVQPEWGQTSVLPMGSSTQQCRPKYGRMPSSLPYRMRAW